MKDASSLHSAGPRVPARHHGFLLSMGGLTVLAWLALWLWAASPYGRYLDHGDWTQIGVAGAICLAFPAGDVVVPAVLYVGGWVLMLVAMMLPTTLPLLEVFRRLTRHRADRHLLLALVVGGYLLAWTGYGVLAHLADLLLFQVVKASPWLAIHGWAIGAAVIAAAGVFQFTGLKHHCLDKCRTPLDLALAHRHGGARSRALGLGWHHGTHCVGCCWALMLLMFVVGTGSVGWMLVLALVMAAEKNLPWGRYLSAPLGAGLLSGAAAIVALHAIP